MLVIPVMEELKRNVCYQHRPFIEANTSSSDQNTTTNDQNNPTGNPAQESYGDQPSAFNSRQPTSAPASVALAAADVIKTANNNNTTIGNTTFLQAFQHSSTINASTTAAFSNDTTVRMSTTTTPFTAGSNRSGNNASVLKTSSAACNKDTEDSINMRCTLCGLYTSCVGYCTCLSDGVCTSQKRHSVDVFEVSQQTNAQVSS